MKNILLKTLQEQGREWKHKWFYLVECPYCHEKIAVPYENAEIILYQPKEIERTYEELHFEDKPDGKIGKLLKKETKTVKELVSTDDSKDIVRIELCPNCGHRPIEMLRTDFLKLPKVGWDGLDTIKLELDEKETKAARAFMQEHKNCCEKHLGKKWFSSTGGQFKYTIVPTGLGSIVGIECGACKKKVNVTNSEDW